MEELASTHDFSVLYPVDAGFALDARWQLDGRPVRHRRLLPGAATRVQGTWDEVAGAATQMALDLEAGDEVAFFPPVSAAGGRMRVDSEIAGTLARPSVLGELALPHAHQVALAEADAPVDLDMLGATGATMLDLGFSPEATWAILAVTRSFAAGAHYIEEVEREESNRLGQQLTPQEDYDGPADRPVPPLSERDKHAESAICRTPDEWNARFEEMKNLRGSGFSIIEEIEDPSKKSGIKKVGKL